MSNFDRIELRKMTSAEYAAYLETSLPAYAAEKQRGEGMTTEQAMKVANESFKKLLPDGLDSKDQFLFSVFESANASTTSDKPVGTLWFAKKTDTGRPSVWIYDIILNENVRGKGYGKQLMTLLEEKVRSLGITSIGLHVFGHNTVATSLYEKMGFRTTNRIMAKDL